MAIDPDYLLTQWPEITHRYTEKDSMLYALGVGLGRDPLNQDELSFVYEDGLKVMPSQAVTLAHPGFWAAEKILISTGSDCFILGKRSSGISRSPLPAR